MRSRLDTLFKPIQCVMVMFLLEICVSKAIQSQAVLIALFVWSTVKVMHKVGCRLFKLFFAVL